MTATSLVLVNGQPATRTTRLADYLEHELRISVVS